MSSFRILVGDCRESLSEVAAASVQCVVTSPPYWGLRDYGHEGQLGLERTPDEYVASMVEVFREVRRVLREDGTLWLNLGDSYTSGGRDGHGTRVGYKQQTNRGMNGTNDPVRAPQPPGLKPKDLVGIPWRVALALQADGWYLRSDIIWSKPNPMPESVRDRPTKAHEYLFLLTKSARYYYNADAIAEPVAESSVARLAQATLPHQRGSDRANGGAKTNGNMKAVGGTETRNRRSVWTIATQPYAEAHFATFPPALVEPCILAGSKSGDVVLDPFMGSGTTGAVAIGHGRRFLGCELNPEYVELARRRIGPMFEEAALAR